MKKILSTLFFTFICLFTFAKGNNIFSFNIKPEYNLMNGNVHEYVFDSRCKNTDNMLSRLDWDVQNISYIGLNASF